MSIGGSSKHIKLNLQSYPMRLVVLFSSLCHLPNFLQLGSRLLSLSLLSCALLLCNTDARAPTFVL